MTTNNKTAEGTMKESPFYDERMPLWITIEAELGYLDFEMKGIAKKMPKSAIAKMIDDSTGFSESLKKDALRLAKRIIELKNAYEQETGHKADTELEEKIVLACSTTPPNYDH